MIRRKLLEGVPRVSLRVQVRPRADLAGVLERVGTALETTDQRLGLSLPIAVQVTGGIRSTFAGNRRVE